MREASYGIITYAKYDSIILGSSIASNFSANEASRLFGSNFINIAIDGCTIRERELLLTRLFQIKNPKIVISSIDEFIDCGYINNFDKLYGSIIDKFSFYMNDRITDIIIDSVIDKNNLIEDLDCPTGWYNDENHSVRFGGFEKWIKAANDGNKQAIASIEAILKKDASNSQYFKDADKIFDQSLLRFCKEHSDTTFFLFFPPYSKIYWKTQSDSCIENYKRLIKHVILSTSKLKNVYIFCFDLNSFTTDISFYKDRVHYNRDINSYILRMMKAGNFLLTKNDVESFLEEFENSIRLFNLDPFVQQIKKSFQPR